MADVFVSYSRVDAEFVSRLVEDLKHRGKDVWVDVDGVRDAERFPEALRRAIEGSDAFVFVISPDSAGSEFCEQEIAHAAALNKRIVPLALRPVADQLIPEEIRFRNWIPVGDDTGVDRVVDAIDTDLEWERQHTRITQRALQWKHAGRDRSVLLRGSELADGERWLAAGAGKDPGPTALEQEYLLAAQHAASRRLRRLTAAVSGMLVVAVGLLVFALISRGQALRAESSANAQRLAALSVNQRPIDPERAVLLAMAAVRSDATYGPSGTMFALRAALDDSTIRYRLTAAGAQNCGSLYPSFDPAPGSNLIAEGLCDGKVRFFNATTGKLERIVTVGSPTDQAILLAYAGHRAVLEGAVGDRLVALAPTTAAVKARGPVIPHLGADALDPNAPLVAAIGRLGQLVIWNTRTGRATQQRLRLPLSELTDLTFGPPGIVALSFAGGNGGTPGVVVYDYVHRRIVATAPTQAANIAYAPGGRWLAVGAQSVDGTGTVEVLNGLTLAVDRAFHPVRDAFEYVAGLYYGLDGRELAYGFQDGSAGLLDATTGQQLNRYAYATGPVYGLAISPNDRLLLTSASDGTTDAFRTGSRTLRTIDAGGSIAQLAVVRDGVVTIANPGPRPGQGVVVEHFSDQGTALAPPLVLSHSTAAIDASLSPSGTVATTAPGAPTVQQAPLHVWNVATRRIINTVPFVNGPSGDPVIGPRDDVIVDPVGPVTGFHPSTPELLELLNLRTGQRRDLGSVTRCDWQGYAIAPSDTTLTATTNCGQALTWNIATGHRLGSIQVSGYINSLAYSPDGDTIAFASSNGTVYVSSVPLAGRLRPISESVKSAQAVAWSPNGRYLASAGLDLNARIYDAGTLTELRVIPLPDPPQGLAFTANSQDLLTWDTSGNIRLFDACTDCENPSALLRLAQSRVTRSLTPAERKTYAVN
jgi:WD40 repeat protein